MPVQSIDDLVQSVTNLDSVIESAVNLINGFSTRLQQGIQDAIQGGATQAELAPLAGLKADLDARAQALAGAVAANTPAQAETGTTTQPPAARRR